MMISVLYCLYYWNDPAAVLDSLIHIRLVRVDDKRSRQWGDRLPYPAPNHPLHRDLLYSVNPEHRIENEASMLRSTDGPSPYPLPLR
jgi:hypothetical protein